MDIVSGKLPGWASVVIVVVVAVGTEAAEVFEDFGVEDGGADFVDAGGPLAEVDLAATVRAEAVSYTHLDVYKRQIHGDAQSANAGLTAALAGLNRDDLGVIHALSG